MIKYHSYIPEMVGMFQKEVADRIVSSEGSKVYGTLSVLTQVYYKVDKIFTVSSGNFDPPPRVDSAVIYCKRRKKPLYNGPLTYLQAIVKAIFGKRRKMVRNSLKSLFPKDKLKDLPYLKLRPEQMPLEYFVELAEIYQKEQEGKM
jgi:16S rRNA (adenine1518-N6/adenine1519-N6)-dimethyltransferase